MTAEIHFSYCYVRPPRESVYTAVLRERGPDVLVFDTPLTPSQPLVVDGATVLADGFCATWFVFRGKPWDVARICRPDGTFTGYYADVTEPVSWDDGDPSTLRIVDLFLDLWVTLDGTYRILDQDELNAAERRGVVSAHQAHGARETLSALIRDVEAGDFPPREVRNVGSGQ